MADDKKIEPIQASGIKRVSRFYQKWKAYPWNTLFTRQYWEVDRKAYKSYRKKQEWEKHLETVDEEKYKFYQEAYDIQNQWLFDEVIRREIEHKAAWFDTTNEEHYRAFKAGNEKYPPFSRNANEMMHAAIKKDRHEKMWRWIAGFLVPLLGAFIGAYLGSK
jgi:hypothetical protein